MAKRLSYQVIEDNGGGLHLAVFNGNECIWYASGYEFIPGFQPTHPCGVRQRSIKSITLAIVVSTHAPLRGATPWARGLGSYA